MLGFGYRTLPYIAVPPYPEVTLPHIATENALIAPKTLQISSVMPLMGLVAAASGKANDLCYNQQHPAQTSRVPRLCSMSRLVESPEAYVNFACGNFSSNLQDFPSNLVITPS